MIAVIIVVVLLIIGAVWTAIRNNNKEANFREELARLQQEYANALQGADRWAALQAGRSYYLMARRGKGTTIHDELVISNDLSTMPQRAHPAKPEETEAVEIDIVKLPTSTIIS